MRFRDGIGRVQAASTARYGYVTTASALGFLGTLVVTLGGAWAQTAAATPPPFQPPAPSAMMTVHVAPISLQQSDQILKARQAARDRIGVMDRPVSRPPVAAGDMHNPAGAQGQNTSH